MEIEMSRGRSAKNTVVETEFFREDFIVLLTGAVLSKGEVFKVIGEHGSRFKFHSFVTNTRTKSQWIDCFQIRKGVSCEYRSFRSDRIKLIPKKRGRKNVS
jgi:hypothetical protein